MNVNGLLRGFVIHVLIIANAGRAKSAAARGGGETLEKNNTGTQCPQTILVDWHRFADRNCSRDLLARKGLIIYNCTTESEKIVVELINNGCQLLPRLGLNEYRYCRSTLQCPSNSLCNQVEDVNVCQCKPPYSSSWNEAECVLPIRRCKEHRDCELRFGPNSICSNNGGCQTERDIPWKWLCFGSFGLSLVLLVGLVVCLVVLFRAGLIVVPLQSWRFRFCSRTPPHISRGRQRTFSSSSNQRYSIAPNRSSSSPPPARSKQEQAELELELRE